MIKKYYDTDCNLGFLDGKTVAIMVTAARATRTHRTCTRAVLTLSLACVRTAQAGRRRRRPA